MEQIAFKEWKKGCSEWERTYEGKGKNETNFKEKNKRPRHTKNDKGPPAGMRTFISWAPTAAKQQDNRGGEREVMNKGKNAAPVRG